jgi:hypothetical protein
LGPRRPALGSAGHFPPVRRQKHAPHRARRPDPALDKILVAALPAGTPSNARPRTADEIAKQHNLIAPLVKRWAQAIASAPSDDPALGDWRAVPDADKPALAEKYARRFAEAWERPDDPISRRSAKGCSTIKPACWRSPTSPNRFTPMRQRPR